MQLLGVRFSFSEADHSKNEGDDNKVIAAQLSKNPDTRLANPVIFRIAPLTIQEANRRGEYVPSSAMLDNDPDSPYEAGKSNCVCFSTIYELYFKE